MSAARIPVFGWLSVAFLGFCSHSGGFAVFSRPAGSEVPRNAATANAAPHTNARAALNVFKPLPAIPRRRPQTTEKLTKVRTAVSHFMEASALLDSVRSRQSPVFCLGRIP